MSYVSYANHFTTKVHPCSSSGIRQAGNPCYGEPYTDDVPSKYKRVVLLIQNQNTSEEVTITFGGGKPLKLFAGQSISFDNFNGGFTVSDMTNVAVFETFA